MFAAFIERLFYPVQALDGIALLAAKSLNLPAAFINLIAIIVPFLEIIIGLALVIGFYPRSAAIILNGILMAYIIALTINLVRGHEFDCGCFAVGQSGYSSSSEVTLVRDIIYFVLGLQIILYSGVRRICSISTPKS